MHAAALPDSSRGHWQIHSLVPRSQLIPLVSPVPCCRVKPYDIFRSFLSSVVPEVLASLVLGKPANLRA